MSNYFNAFNLFEWVIKLLDILDVSYERAYMAIQFTISDSVHSDSEEYVDAISDSEEQVDAISNSEELVDAVINPKSDPISDPKVATYTTNGNFPQKLLKNRFVPKIIKGEIRPIDQLSTENVPGIR